MSAELTIAGEGEPAGALGSLLAERGHAVEVCTIQGTGARSALLADALVRLERALEERPAPVLVSVGSGPVASAAALVAGKSGCALVCCFLPPGADGDELAADERRALGVLSELQIELVGDDGQAITAAATEISDWLAARAGASTAGAAK